MVSRHRKKRREIKRRNGARGKEGCYPYHPGTVLKVEFWPESETLGVGGCLHEGKEVEHQISGKFIKLTVVKTFSRTLSCVLLGSVDLGGLDEKSRAAFAAGHTHYDDHESRTKIKVVLKLYDRRFSDGIREDYGAAQWTPKIEADRKIFEALDEQGRPEVCVEGVCGSRLYRSSENEEDRNDGDGDETERPTPHGKKGRRNFEGRNLTTKDNINDEQPSQTASAQKKISPSKWTAGHREAYMQKVCDRSFSTEHLIYQHLRPAQGRLVPFIYGTVRLRIGEQVNGLMMEYLQPSFTLRDIPANVPDTGMWQDLGEMAVGLVQDVGDCGVLNEDVRLDNILVVPVKEGYYEYEDEEDLDSRKLRFFKTVMIDFGLGRVRREDEADEDWKKARYFRDEEGAVGYVLESFLRTAAGEATPFKFRHSHRLQLQDYDEEI